MTSLGCLEEETNLAGYYEVLLFLFFSKYLPKYSTTPSQNIPIRGVTPFTTVFLSLIITI